MPNSTTMGGDLRHFANQQKRFMASSSDHGHFPNQTVSSVFKKDSKLDSNFSSSNQYQSTQASFLLNGAAITHHNHNNGGQPF